MMDTVARTRSRFRIRITDMHQERPPLCAFLSFEWGNLSPYGILSILAIYQVSCFVTESGFSMPLTHTFFCIFGNNIACFDTIITYMCFVLKWKTRGFVCSYLAPQNVGQEFLWENMCRIIDCACSHCLVMNYYVNFLGRISR